MQQRITDEMLGAYVDHELDPASMQHVEAAAERSGEIRERLDAIRRVTAAVRALCRARVASRGPDSR